MNNITSKSYTLRTESGSWLGQVVLTSDGMFASVTDYGNLSYAWRHYGEGDFRKFLIGLNVEYFGGKMYQGMTYMIHGKQYEKACDRFAEKDTTSLAKGSKGRIGTRTATGYLTKGEETMKTENELIEDFWISQGGKPHWKPDLSFYESSWDMLMPVVEKITPIAKEKGQQAWFDTKYHLIEADIACVHRSVVSFIRWYNSQNS